MRKLFGVLFVSLVVLAFSAAGALAGPYALGDLGLPDDYYDTMVNPRDLIPNYDSYVEALPASYDARDDGIVTTPKDQGSCGSCWAFATVGAMEAHDLKDTADAAYATSPDFSEQQILDCNSFGYSCSGGSMDAVQFYYTNGPCNESDYPYTQAQGTCGSCTENGLNSTNYMTVDATDQDAVKTSLDTYGPSYFRYDVYSDFYDFWNTGAPGDVYTNAYGSFEGGHAVLIIGWDDSKSAWLLKNSWGATGGPNGDGSFWMAWTGHNIDLNFGMSNFETTGSGPSSSSSSSSSSGGSSGGGGCFLTVVQ